VDISAVATFPRETLLGGRENSNRGVG
jgi:hypothetical protein